MMHLNQIKSFLTVSKLLNFTNAARQNGVPQSTISRQINDLEQQLGVRLFYRTKRDVQLTEEGRTFIPYAQEILDTAKKGAYAVKQLHDGARGRLSIATIPSADSFLQGCLTEFAQKYPDIIVDITYISGGEMLLGENEDPYDFHFLYTDILPDSDEFDVLDICADRLSFVFPAGWLEKHNVNADNKISAEMLREEKFILLTEAENPLLYMQIMNFCRTHRFSPVTANRFSDVRSVLLSVSAGLGISILPGLAGEWAGYDANDTWLSQELSSKVSMLPPGLEVCPIGDSCSIDCAAAWKKSLLNPAAALFLEIIRRRCR